MTFANNSHLPAFTVLCWLLSCAWPVCALAQRPQDPESSDSGEHMESVAESAAAQSEEGSPGTEEIAPDERAGAALRNENVFASKLDNNTQKADNQRLGGTYTILTRQPVEMKYYGAEYGNTPIQPPVLGRPSALVDTWHGEIFETMQNSVFNARTYFQSGPVLPSRMNQYGGRFTGRVPKWGFLTGSFGQTKNRGMVNGNVLVPLPSERTPLTTDPTLRPIVERYLSAYPQQVPNRTDIDPRALNTNAPQSIDTLDASLRLDRSTGSRGMLSLFHDFNRQNIRAFQFVAGQNPDTAIHSQSSQITYRLSLSDSTEYSFGVGYTRRRSDLHPDPTAVGPRVNVGGVIQGLGPGGQYPLNRAENTFRYGAIGTHRLAGGRHRLTFGADLSRYQFNGFEQNGTRGSFGFSNNFGHTALENLLLGQPTGYSVRVGNHYRGFRTWSTEVYLADEWNVTPDFQLYFGLRHSMTTVPVEVNGLNSFPFKTDRNNFGPSFSFAYRGPKDWVARGNYSISFGVIFPVTYSQIRYNAPGVIALSVNNPDLADPLRGIDVSVPNQRVSPIRFSPDLATPYVHQYSFSLQKAVGPMTLDFAYLGSRLIKPLAGLSLNRARVVPGIPLTTGTINQRRPDQNYFDVTEVVNAGIAYLDAGQFSWRFRAFRGFTGGGAYTFSKALDQGAMYNSTAANNDLFSRSQSEYFNLQDQKALSQFDSPHSLTLFFAQQTPAFKSFARPLAAIAGNWQISGVIAAKTGTPFGVSSGSDSPGFGNVDGVGSDRPNILNPDILGMSIGDPETSQQLLNRANFAFIQPGDLAGNLGRNTFRRGSIFNVNASIAREWRFGGSRPYTLRFQGDAYNLTNHPQFNRPQNNLTSPSFGKITNTLNNGRVLQFGIRLVL
jgi:hypothetical protein